MPASKRTKRQARRAMEAQEEVTRAAELARLAGEGPRDAAFYEREVCGMSAVHDSGILVGMT